MTEAGRNKRMELITEEIQNRYGIIISWKQVGELLMLKSATAINGWIRRNALIPAGRKGYYYSRDVARAIVENGAASA